MHNLLTSFMSVKNTLYTIKLVLNNWHSQAQLYRLIQKSWIIFCFVFMNKEMHKSGQIYFPMKHVTTYELFRGHIEVILMWCCRNNIMKVFTVDVFILLVGLKLQAQLFCSNRHFCNICCGIELALKTFLPPYKYALLCAGLFKIH